MKQFLANAFKFFCLGTLAVTLVLVIWQPVFPSIWIIKQMTSMISPETLPFDDTVVVRFELTGRGGGVYNIVASKDAVEMVEGKETDTVDLILFMKATDFNEVMLQMATGQLDEFAMKGLVIAKVMRFAGDIQLLETLFKGLDPNASAS